MENYLLVLKICFSEASFIHSKVKNLFDRIRDMRSQLHHYIEKYDGTFLFSLVGTIHTAIALFVNAILRDPSSGSKDGLNLSFIQTALQNNTFMNTYAMPLIGNDKEIENTDSPAFETDRNNKCSSDRDSSRGSGH